MCTINKANKQKLELDNKVIDSNFGIDSTILDAFKPYDSSQLTMNNRFEEEFFLPNKQIASLDDLIVVAAILGSMLSAEGRVTLGINTSESSTYLEVDAMKLHEASNLHEFIMNLRQTAELTRFNVMIPMDIEVSHGKIIPLEESPIWLSAQGNRCTLSVIGNSVEAEMFPHLCKVTKFAFDHVFNDDKAIPVVDSLPVRPEYEQQQRKSMIEYIFDHNQKKPSDLAIVDDISNQTLTYAELWEASESIVNQINEQVITKQTYLRVAIFMERGWQHLISLIAVQRMGGTCVLVDLTNPDDRLRDFLNESDPDVILAVDITIDRARGLITYPVLDFDKLINQPAQINNEQDIWHKTDNQVCFIAGTSGTTGRPKASCLSYRGMAATIETIINAAELGGNSRGSWLSSPGYGMIEVDPIPVLCAGGTVYIPLTNVLKNIQTLACWFDENKITNTLVMTSIAEALWANGVHNGLHTMLIAGERCKQWPTTEYRVLNVYGSAEAAVVSIEDISGVRRTQLPTVGRAVSGVNMYVVDGVGQELPACCVGELIITGETLSMGYLNYDETQKSFQPNQLDLISELQYVSGDRARMSLDGTVEIFGRSNALVKIRGHRVDLSEVEITALKINGVAKAAAICFDDNAGTILELFIEPVSNVEGIKVEEIEKVVRQYLSKKLHPAAQPSRINTMELPLGYNGKVDRTALRACLVERDKVHTPFYPNTKIESAIRQCWLKWIRCDEISLESDFFQSGGDSLRVMRMIGDLAYKHGINIEMSCFLEKPIFSNLLRLANNSNAISMPVFENLPIDKQIDPFNLTEYQQALWLGRGTDFNYGNIGCQGYFEWEVKHLDYGRFVRAVGMLVNRHPMLRTTIDNTGSQRIGIVDGEQAVAFIDLSSFSTTKIDNEINKIRYRMSTDEIGIAKWPLFSFIVSRVNEKTSRIHFNIDLLIADAWSIFQVIIPDLIELYSNEKPQLPKIQTTFQDYVAYRNEVKSSEQYRTHREYWLKKIYELPDAPKLPQLKQIESDTSVRFERHEGILAKESWELLKTQAQERKISPSCAVGLVLCEVLRFWSEEDHFTLNLPISDRMSVSDDIHLIVGDFTNPLLVPYETAGEDTLQTRGQLLQEAIWEALEHRLFTGVEVLRELSRIKRAGTKPLMPVVFTSLIGHSGRYDVSVLGQEVFGISQTPQVTLDVQVRESEGSLHFKWDYLSGGIRPEVVEAMFDSFCKLLQQLADKPEIWKRTRLNF